MIRSTQRNAWLRATVLASALAVLFAAGCEDDDADYYDHDPPDGQGSIIVVNNTTDDISVFVNGEAQPEAPEDNWVPYDLDPGVYRVVLEQQGGDHNWSEDVDVLENRGTILDVIFDDDNDETRYDVLIRYD